LRRLAEHGLAAVAPDDDAARGRLAEIVDFCDFSLDEQHATLERWRARRSGRGETLRAPNRETGGGA